MEKKYLRVNMEKIKIVVTGNNLDLLKNLESIPVCQTGVSSNAIFCGGCLRWIHKKCSDIKEPLRPDPEFRCARCLEKAQPIDGRTMKEVKINDEIHKAIPEFCYLGDNLSAGGG